MVIPKDTCSSENVLLPVPIRSLPPDIAPAFMLCASLHMGYTVCYSRHISITPSIQANLNLTADMSLSDQSQLWTTISHRASPNPASQPLTSLETDLPIPGSKILDIRQHGKSYYGLTARVAAELPSGWLVDYFLKVAFPLC